MYSDWGCMWSMEVEYRAVAFRQSKQGWAEAGRVGGEENREGQSLLLTTTPSVCACLCECRLVRSFQYTYNTFARTAYRTYVCAVLRSLTLTHDFCCSPCKFYILTTEYNGLLVASLSPPLQCYVCFKRTWRNGIWFVITWKLFCEWVWAQRFYLRQHSSHEYKYSL